MPIKTIKHEAAARGQLFQLSSCSNSSIMSIVILIKIASKLKGSFLFSVDGAGIKQSPSLRTNYFKVRTSRKTVDLRQRIVRCLVQLNKQWLGLGGGSCLSSEKAISPNNGVNLTWPAWFILYQTIRTIFLKLIQLTTAKTVREHTSKTPIQSSALAWPVGRLAALTHGVLLSLWEAMRKLMAWRVFTLN